jgi:hypothetical protein
MNIEPIPSQLYKRLVEAGVKNVQLSWSGGSDEGLLDVIITHESEGKLPPEAWDLQSVVDDWAWDVYSYSGAGDGNDYGDDIRYDLTTMKATHSEWYMSRCDSADTTEPFGLSDTDAVNDESNQDRELDLLKARFPELRAALKVAVMEGDYVTAMNIVDSLGTIVEEAVQ